MLSRLVATQSLTLSSKLLVGDLIGRLGEVTTSDFLIILIDLTAIILPPILSNDSNLARGAGLAPDSFPQELTVNHSLV